MTPEDLSDRATAELERQQGFRERLHCCTAAGCLSCGAEELKRELNAQVEARGLSQQVEVHGTGCLGLCSRGPLLRRASDGAVFHELEPSEAGLLLQGGPAACAAAAAPASRPG
jgi:NADH:ubiquinone oxidoreductase subunit E